MVAQSNAYKEWAKEKTVMITMRLQRSTDADILAYLEGKQKQTEIKKALRYWISAQAEKAEYKYGMRLRGYSPGAQPGGVLRREDDPTGKYHDIIVYARQLSADEIADYELDDLN